MRLVVRAAAIVVTGSDVSVGVDAKTAEEFMFTVVLEP